MATEVVYPKMGDKTARKLRISGDPEIMNLRQLRVELKRMGLSPSGSKAELMKRYRLATGIDDPSIYTAENGAPPELKLFSYPGGRGKNRKDKDSNTAERKAEKSQNTKRKSKIPNQYVVPSSKLKYSEWAEDEEDEEYEDSSDNSSDEEEEEAKRSIQSFHDKRKALGLSDEEIERRKRAKFDNAGSAYITREDQQKLGFLTDIPMLDEREMVDWIPSLYGSPSLRTNGSSEIETKQNENMEEYLIDVAQIRFFDHATLELERLQMQKKYDEELSNLEGRIQKMKKELESKDKIIQSLKNSLSEKDQTLLKASNMGISSATTVTQNGINNSTQEALKNSIQPFQSSA